MDQFIAQILAQLDTKQAETDLSNLTKDREVNIDIKLTGEVDFLKSIKNSLSSASSAIAKSGSDAGKSYTTALQKQIETVARTQRNAFSEPLNNMTKSEMAYSDWFNKELKKIEDYEERFSQYQNRFINLQNKDISKYSNSSVYENIKINLKEIEQLQERINLEKSKGDDGNIDQIKSDLKEMNSLLNKTETQYSKLSKPIGTLDATIASNKTLSWLNENSKAVKELGNAFEELARKQKTATTAGELEGYNKEFINLVNIAKSKGLTGKSWFDDAKRAVSQIAQFTGIYGVLQNVMQDIPREMVKAVYDVDTAMTNLYKVTDETSAKYNEFLDNAGTKAQELGRTISSLVTQTSEWAKLGYSLDEASELSKISSIYANVGEVSDETAVSDIVTAMKAYNIMASDAMKITDSYNELGNRFATDAASLGEGISKAASSLAAAGNDLNQSLAMLTGMTEITQNASEAGNALKILSMRLRGYDEETESYSKDIEELSGEIASLTKTASTPGGISIFSDDAKETYKSTFEIMKEIADIWNDLTDKNQAELTEVLAGKNRGNQISALMQAFQSGQVEKAYTTSINSEGSALKEQERWMNSLEAKVQQFQASFQQLSNTTLNSDFLKAFVDGGTTALNIINELIDNLGTLQILIGGFATVKGITSFVKSFDKSAARLG